MSKRPSIDLMAITAEEAAPMPEAVQRSAAIEKPGKDLDIPTKLTKRARTEDLVPLSFKVSPFFDDRFRRCAFDAKLKLNELLFEALDAWEAKKRR
jgi:hypothetical protein